MPYLNIKKLARFQRPGHRVTDNRRINSDGIGWEYVYLAIGDHLRVAFGSIELDACGISACRALLQARRLGVRFERVLADSGACYRSRLFRRVVRRLRIRHPRTCPHTPRINGKAERLVRTRPREWAHARSHAMSDHRADAFVHWLHQYDWRRPHASLGHKPTIFRIPVNNLVGFLG
ncbi:hypothetical protein EBB59_07720 [Lysobacter pythonis]|uniref:Integrase catalytic domain-containing protein n=1 Tax=Solilutibacter pythonis TaxID=2483112 RepID=A0A3M2I103_9GAMM|nr:integrase core domain-containing protein [Lysobacter pythonis]RMH92842.1 hypothetical protein EBB59_07720 [Lysobacter pythonis]